MYIYKSDLIQTTPLKIKLKLKQLKHSSYYGSSDISSDRIIVK